MGIRQAIGNWISGNRPQQTVGEPRGVRPEMVESLMGELRTVKQQLASYDAARNGAEYRNIWANADFLDADSANSRPVRQALMARSRYEIQNNGFSDGIAQTYSTDLVGKGPTLRMQTNSQPLNQLIERVFGVWAKAVNLRSKLWTMAHAKHSDGEGFAILRRNPNVDHPVKLDVVLVEADQCQSPWLTVDDDRHIDGVRFDKFGNPIWYEFLTNHPGSNHRAHVDSETEKVDARLVLHWFKVRRPGQHRGIPEMASTLNSGAAARRWREATIAAAETAADFSLLVKTTQNQSGESDDVAPFSEMDINKRTMAFLPMGWDPFQLKGEFPTATHESFNKGLINEQARPKNMPYNKAACDSSSYNYASGRLDHQTYYGSLDVERGDCDEKVLEKIFRVWLAEAVAIYKWFGGVLASAFSFAHSWDWPKHQVADIKAEATANAEKLTTGQISLPRLYSDAGYDFDDEVAEMAKAFGVDETEIRRRLLNIVLPDKTGGGSIDAAVSSVAAKAATAAAESVLSESHSRFSKVNGNGALHAN